jgi:hypothetical protein
LILTGGLTGIENFVLEQGAHLVLYCDNSINLYADHIINPNGNADSFIIRATTNVTSVTLRQNGTFTSTFTGLLVVPSANVTVLTPTSPLLAFCGALVANSFTSIGNLAFHFDEHLLPPQIPGTNLPRLVFFLTPTHQFGFDTAGFFPTAPYVIQSSTNLTDWVPVLTNNGSALHFIDSDTPKNPLKFYRAVPLP